MGYCGVRVIGRSSHAVEATVEDFLVVMNVETLDYYRFNSVAQRIWELLEPGPLDEQQLCAALLQEFEVSEVECQASVEEFVDEAIARGFLNTL